MKRTHLLIYAAVAGLIISMFGATFYLWNQLPAMVPTHFNFAGNVDAWATKNFVSLFLIPLVNLGIFLLLLLLYRYPQYSSWPTTLILMTVETTKREKIYDVLRAMNALVLLAITLMFGYIQYIILATSNGRMPGLESAVMIGFLAVLLLVIIYVNVRMFVTIRKMIRKKA